MAKVINLMGQRFGKLVVVGRSDNIGTFAAWECDCDCGNRIIAIGASLRNGHTKSCGCLRKDFLKNNSIAKRFHERAFLYSINEMVNTKSGNIEIIERKYREEKSHDNGILHRKYYRYRCAVCGNVDWISEQVLNKGAGCNVCSGKKVMEGYNDLLTTHPFMQIYFSEKNDAYKYSAGSNKRIKPICPGCRRESTKSYSIYQLVKYGYTCDECTQRGSFGERIVRSILKHSGIGFSEQYTVRVKGKRLRFDFWLCDYKTVVETDGMQHFEPVDFSGEGINFAYKNFDDTQYRDKIKNEFCINSGITLIRIDTRKSDFQDIYKTVSKSKLNEIIDFDNINVCDVYTDAFTYDYEHIVKRYLDGETKANISKETGISLKTVRKIIGDASKIGLCMDRGCAKSSKYIRCVNTGEIFKSAKDISFSYKIDPNQIHKVCKHCLNYNTAGKHPETGEKLRWEYVESA